MARMLYPPPGNTTTAAPVFLPFGVYTVMVGVETLPSRTTGRPAIRLSFAVVMSASGGMFADSPGATPGHTGNVT